MVNTTTAFTSRLTCLGSKLDQKYCKEYGEERSKQYLNSYEVPYGMETDTKGFIVIDLIKENIKQNIRKSYKSLVNKTDGIIFSPSVRNLQLLHRKVAGRTTRSDKTWDIQQEMIECGEAFVVELYKDGTLISAALFYKNKYCCYYACAASLTCVNSHAVIWSAIEFCKAEGLKRFELGEKIEGTEKEKNISKFKSGFGGHLEKRLVQRK